jgi:transcriptional regulator GlxA family with amidase domain
MEVAIFVMDGVADFGLAAIREVLDTANSLRHELHTAPPPWATHLVSVGRSVQSGSGYRLPTTPVTRVAGQFDLLIVPAVNVLEGDGLVELVSSPAHRDALELIATASNDGASLAAACTGTFFLAEAGVLDGAVVTTSWWLGPTFRRRYPNVTLEIKRTLCRAEQITTAGASLAHVDLALSLVNTHSPALAELVSRYMMIGNRTTQANFIIPEVIARADPLVASFERWVRQHLADQIQITTVARELGVTERTLQRATAAELGMPPREFVHSIRLEHATKLLRDTTLTTDAVAARVGYLHGSTLRNLIRRRHGTTISEIRAARSTQ